MGHRAHQNALHILTDRPVLHALNLHALVTDDGILSVTRGRVELSSRKMLFEQVGCIQVERPETLSRADWLVIAAQVNLDDESAPW